MKRSKIVSGDYIIGLSLNGDGILITKEEYNKIKETLTKIPKVEEGKIARLRDKDLTWVILDVN